MFLQCLACKFNVKWIVSEADIQNRFLKNTRLRPLVKITIDVSNFLIRYRTINSLLQGGKEPLRIAYKKICLSTKPYVPSRFLKQFRSFCERLR